jgi:hypothetical protein
MSDFTILFAAGILVVVLVTVAVLLLWRVRAHAKTRADAEARMAAAMEELQRLAARLQAQKAELERSGAPPSDSHSHT